MGAMQRPVVFVLALVVGAFCVGHYLGFRNCLPALDPHRSTAPSSDGAGARGGRAVLSELVVATEKVADAGLAPEATSRPSAEPTSTASQADTGQVTEVLPLSMERAKAYLLQLKAAAKDTRLIHVHIPKSGGTMFSYIMSAAQCNCVFIAANGCRGCRNPMIRPVNRLTSAWPCENKMLHPTFYQWKHMCPNIYRRVPISTRNVYVTMLRNATKRFLSESFHCRRKVDCFGLTPKDRSLKGFINSDGSMAHFERMTRMIDPTPVFLPQQANPLPHRYEWSEENRQASLVRAKKVLADDPNFFFGVYERVDEVRELMAFVFEQEFPPFGNKTTHNRLNGTQTNADFLNESLTPALEAILVDKNRGDMELYEFAQRLFDVRFRAYLELKG